MKTRTEILEANYRRLVSEKIYELSVIMSPEEQLAIGAMKYLDLLAYAQRKIAAERAEIESDSDDGLVI